MAKGPRTPDRDDVPPVLKHPSLARQAKGDPPDPPRVLGPCVVLAPLDRRLEQDLLSTLEQAGLSPRVEHDPHLAMAEACLLRREARQRRGIGGSADPAPLILIEDPSDEAVTMVEAMIHHVADIPIMRYAHGSLSPLQAGASDDAHGTPPELVDPPVVIQPPRGREVTDDELASLLRAASGDGSGS